MSIKGLYIFLLLLLFTQPILTLISFDNKESVDIVFVDDSRSMNIEHGNTFGRNEIMSVINEFDLKNDRFKLIKYSDNDQIPSLVSDYNQQTFSGFETDLQNNLVNYKEHNQFQNINSLTIISDGNLNSGGYPSTILRTISSNVITIGIGDTIQSKDLVLKYLFYNDKVLTGQNTFIKVQIEALKCINENITIKLFKENELIRTESIRINTDNETRELIFNFTENNEGYIRYRVELEPVTNEKLIINNYDHAIIEFISRNMNVLFLSSGPGFDNSLISGIMKRISGFNVIARTLKADNSFYEGSLESDLNKYNLIILFDFPSAKTTAEGFNFIANSITKYKIPFIVIVGKQFDHNKFSIIEEYLPYSILRSGTETRVSARSVAFEESIDELPKDLPEFYKNISGITQKPGSLVQYIDNISGEPLMLSRTQNNINSLAFIGYGFWKWKLNINEDRSAIMEKLMISFINRTMHKDRDKNFDLSTEKNIFDILEKPVIFARFSDLNVNRNDMQIMAGLRSNNNLILKDLKFNYINEEFVLTLPVLNKGDYFIEAEANTTEGVIERDVLRFLVDSTNLEFKNTISNYNLLKDIAYNNQGIFITSDLDNKDTYYSFIDSIRNINSENISLGSPKSYNFRENLWVLIIIIMLFSIEWVMRKRNNIS